VIAVVESRDGNGVVITSKEIYTLLLDVDKKLTIANQRIEELYKIQPMCEKRKEHCDDEFNSVYNIINTNSTDISGLKAQLKTVWAVLTIVLTSIVATVYKFFEGGR